MQQARNRQKIHHHHPPPSYVLLVPGSSLRPKGLTESPAPSLSPSGGSKMIQPQLWLGSPTMESRVLCLLPGLQCLRTGGTRSGQPAPFLPPVPALCFQDTIRLSSQCRCPNPIFSCPSNYSLSVLSPRHLGKLLQAHPSIHNVPSDWCLDPLQLALVFHTFPAWFLSLLKLQTPVLVSHSALPCSLPLPPPKLSLSVQLCAMLHLCCLRIPMSLGEPPPFPSSGAGIRRPSLIPRTGCT